jgi:hypothetical protein
MQTSVSWRAAATAASHSREVSSASARSCAASASISRACVASAFSSAVLRARTQQQQQREKKKKKKCTKSVKKRGCERVSFHESLSCIYGFLKQCNWICHAPAGALGADNGLGAAGALEVELGLEPVARGARCRKLFGEPLGISARGRNVGARPVQRRLALAQGCGHFFSFFSHSYGSYKKERERGSRPECVRDR